MSDVNTASYWDERFATDWRERGGPAQSRVFMDLLLTHLPGVVHDEIARRPLSVLDAGCAEGDGTARLARAFPRSAVAGFDFSPVAVDHARAKHPGLEFFVSSFEALARGAGAIVVSNCLEHVPNAIDTLRTLAARAERYLIVLLPYAESYPPDPEHRLQVHADTFPHELGAWSLTHRTLVAPSPVWAGYQLLMVYETPRPAERPPLAPLPDAATLALGLRALKAEADAADLRERCARLGDALAREQRAVHDAAARLEAEGECNRSLGRELEEAQRYVRDVAAERDATVAALNASLAAVTRQLEAARHAQAVAADALAAERAGWRDRVAAAGRRIALLEREGDVRARAVTEAGRRLEAARRELARVDGESYARHQHLQFALSEIERLRDTRGRRLARRLGQAAAGPRRLLWRLTAPGTPLYRLTRRLVPGPLTRRLRTALAPFPGAPAAVEAAPAASEPDAQAPLPTGRYDVIVLSIVDWDFRFQRPQQMATQFARHGHRVFYLSTTQFLVDGTADWTLARRLDGVAEVRIRAPRPLDVYGGLLAPSDLEVLGRAFTSLARELAIADAVCHVHAPSWWPLARWLRETLGWRVVYDCMDDWTNFPGFTDAVLALEQDLVREADLTVAPAVRLVEKWRPVARALVRVPNGVDLAHYRAGYADRGVLAGTPGPVIGYFGALAKWVDVPLLERIARHRPDATLVLAGGHFDVDLAPIASLPNVRLLGQRPYADMPPLLWAFDVCIIPFLVDDITEATNPVKFYEYLFSGKPIVAPALPELEPFADLVYLARGHAEFLDQLDRALAEPLDDERRAARRRLAEDHDWAARYRAMDEASRRAFPLVSVVTVTYGGLELTRACLDSLREAETWPHLEVVVVDNASPDDTPEYLRWLADVDPRVRVLLNAENRGFPAATNLGIRAARGSIVVLLNNDTVVPPGLIGRLVRHLARDPSIGLVCPTTNFCGNEARIDPDYADLFGLPAFAAARARDFAGQAFDIAVAAMYCVAARAEVLRRVGPLDEAFGIGLFEDDDFSIRIRQAGYRVTCARDAYVHHVGQGSFQLLTPAEYAALWSQNQAHFEAKWGLAWTPHRTADGVSAPESRIGL